MERDDLRFFRFGYPCPVRPPKDPGPYQIRDGAAFIELTEPLRDRGWNYDTIICNYPYREGNGDIIMGPEYFRFLRPDDCLVQTTRPPLNDDQTKNRKKIPRSRSHLENAIFSEMAKFFEFVCREQVRLALALVERAAASAGVPVDEFPSRYHFHQHHDARITKVGFLDDSRKAGSRKAEDYRALGFFIHLPAIENYGCRWIGSFGMGGFETLVWNRLIRINHAEWLERPCFVMAEMNLNGLPELPVTLHFAEEIPVKILIEESLG
ncbi:MAG: hypothetical protein KDM63_17155 [Verrucomicrobiae bacterium]|nr:hypothetical protein [Verrucomicrobiae bacterium]MCB1091176.1 hypothetical protein [Verrucomicrobiae bacterium]